MLNVLDIPISPLGAHIRAFPLVEQRTEGALHEQEHDGAVHPPPTQCMSLRWAALEEAFHSEAFHSGASISQVSPVSPLLCVSSLLPVCVQLDATGTGWR